MNPELVRDTEITVGALRQIPARKPPVGLTAVLRVAASRERQRRNFTRAERFQLWRQRVQLHADNLMRPIAVPAAGGLFSAFALFIMWVVPAYPLRTVNASMDVPTMLTTEAGILGTIPVGVSSGSEAVVDVMVDEQGRMVDYRVVSGAAMLSKTMRRRLENTLLFTAFVPATTFGIPQTVSIVRVSVGLNSRVEVKG
jgi:hypothetical protein